MKCGIEIPENQVFCDQCLSVMDQYPIKPDARIHLPKRATESDVPKKSKKKRAPSPEEQIALLRLKVLRIRLVAVILAFLLCVASAFLALVIYEVYFAPVTGRNYTIDPSMNDLSRCSKCFT